MMVVRTVRPSASAVCLRMRLDPWPDGSLAEHRQLTPLPPGVTTWGKLFIAVHRLFLPLIEIPSAVVDLPLGDEPLPLQEYGIPGRIQHTPGHTAGPVSILLDSGEAFVGDS